MSADAVFTEEKYTLTVSKQGEGTVSKSPDQSSYPSGTQVTLTATPATGWQFSQWQVDGYTVSTYKSYTLTMNAPHTVIAIFWQ
jgi:hypothetical protein